MVLILALLMAFLAIGLLSRRYNGRTSLILCVVIAAAIVLFYRIG